MYPRDVPCGHGHSNATESSCFVPGIGHGHSKSRHRRSQKDLAVSHYLDTVQHLRTHHQTSELFSNDLFHQSQITKWYVAGQVLVFADGRLGGILEPTAVRRRELWVAQATAGVAHFRCQYRLVVSCQLVQHDASIVIKIATMTHSHPHPKSLLTTGHRCSCRRRSGFHLPRIQASVGWVQAPILHLRNRGQEDNQN